MVGAGDFHPQLPESTAKNLHNNTGGRKSANKFKLEIETKFPPMNRDSQNKRILDYK